MQFMTLFTWHPDQAEIPAPADLREAERLNALPLVRAGFLQPPMIVPLKPYSGLRSPLLAGRRAMKAVVLKKFGGRENHSPADRGLRHAHPFRRSG
jgi:hypothetical protein